MSKESQLLIPKIIAATTEKEAADVLRDTLTALNLTTDYIELNKIKNVLQGYEVEFKDISDRYRELASPKTYTDLHEVRVELNFLYRDVTDNCSFEINQKKIYWEERKTVIRGEAMFEIAGDENKQKVVKATSASALRDVYGAADSMKEYVHLYAISYGLYKNLESLLTSIRMMIDSISSEEKHLLFIEQKDAK